MHESGAVMGQSLPTPSIDIQRAVIAATQASGHVAVVHCLTRADTLDMLSLGVNGLAHTFIDEPINEDVVAAYKKVGAWCNPTLAVLGSLTREGVKEKLTEKGCANLCRCMGFARDGATIKYAYETVRKLKAEGVPIIV
jgi:hypothetical protein